MYRYLASLFLVALMALPAYAANGKKGADTGGFDGPVVGVQAETVKAALELPKGARVVLTGQVTGRLAGSKDEYTFKDATGEMTVEIDKKVFKGRVITPNETVRLAGKIDRDRQEAAKLDVKILEISK